MLLYYQNLPLLSTIMFSFLYLCSFDQCTQRCEIWSFEGQIALYFRKPDSIFLQNLFLLAKFDFRQLSAASANSITSLQSCLEQLNTEAFVMHKKEYLGNGRSKKSVIFLSCISARQVKRQVLLKVGCLSHRILSNVYEIKV